MKAGLKNGAGGVRGGRRYAAGWARSARGEARWIAASLRSSQ